MKKRKVITGRIYTLFPSLVAPPRKINPSKETMKSKIVEQITLRKKEGSTSTRVLERSLLTFFDNIKVGGIMNEIFHWLSRLNLLTSASPKCLLMAGVPLTSCILTFSKNRVGKKEDVALQNIQYASLQWHNNLSLRIC